jgi:hypothetical protein
MAQWLVLMNLLYEAAPMVVEADTEEDAVIAAENLEGSLDTGYLVDWHVTSVKIIKDRT